MICHRKLIRDVEKILEDISTNAIRNGHPDPVVRMDPYFEPMYITENNVTFSYEQEDTDRIKVKELSKEDLDVLMQVIFGDMFAKPSRPTPRLVSSNEDVIKAKSTASLVLINQD